MEQIRRVLLGILLLLVLLPNQIVNAKIRNLGCFSSLKKTIKISADKYREIVLSSDENPNDIQVYCETKNTKVAFYIPEKNIEFALNEKDTVCFSVLLQKEKDTCHIRVIGVKEIPNTLSTSEKVYYLSEFWSEVKYNFVNINYVGFDWDSLYFAYLPRVVNSVNDYEYERLMSSFAASLKDGHTQMQIGDFYTYMDYIPVRLRDFEKRVYLTDIRKGIGLDSTFLGGEIVSISGVPTADYLRDSIFPYISASTEQHLWMQGISECQNGLRVNDFKAEVKKIDGSVVSINIKRNGEQTRTDTDESYKVIEFHIGSRESIELIWLSDSIAHLKLRRFSPEESVINKIYALQEEISNAKGLIVDIRENGGGSTGAAFIVQSYLTPPGQDWFLNFGWSTRINDGVKKANGNWIEEYEDFYKEKALRNEAPDTIYIGDTILRFTMPTAVIYGRYTFSAAEDFLVNLYELPNRPVFIGEPSGGSTGSPLVLFNMPFGGYARICTRQIQYPYSGKPFVQEGVKPDILIKESYEDYSSGKDVVLERATQYIKRGE